MAVFDNITIQRGYVEGEYFEVYSANMQLNNEIRNVQLQRASNGKWCAIDRCDTTIYVLEADNKESINDWNNGEDVEITDRIPRNPN